MQVLLRSLRKRTMSILHNLANSLLGICPKEIEVTHRINACTYVDNETLFVGKMGSNYPSINKYIKTMWISCSHKYRGTGISGKPDGIPDHYAKSNN